MNYGPTIKTARESLGLSQTDLAERMGVAQPSLSRTEAGKRTPTLATLLRAAEAMGMTLTELLDYA